MKSSNPFDNNRHLLTENPNNESEEDVHANCNDLNERPGCTAN